MAFPVVAARNSGSTPAGSPTDTHPINLPAGVVAGNRLVVVMGCDSGPSLDPDAASLARGWAKIAAVEPAAVVGGAVFEKNATGDDALTVTSAFAEESSHRSFRITGGGTPTASSASGSGADGDPPSHTPAGGAQDYLWIVALIDESTNVATAAPANYSNFNSVTSGTSGASLATAERTLNAASTDPGPFTSPAEDWVAFTIAVPPSGASTVGAVSATTTAAATASATTGNAGARTRAFLTLI